jgi:hypothetical protein
VNGIASIFRELHSLLRREAFTDFAGMPEIQEHGDRTTRIHMRDSKENETILPIENTLIGQPNDAHVAAQSSGDRVLVLMDLDNGLVGWESDEDPDNPQYIHFDRFLDVALTVMQKLDFRQEVDANDMGHSHDYLLSNNIFYLRTRHQPDAGGVRRHL